MTIHKGWTFLLTSIVLAALGAATHFSPGVGLMVGSAGFFIAAFVSILPEM